MRCSTKMSKVQINNVVVLNNPATFQSPFQFEITFDCMENLEDDLEWKLTYVGCAESSNHEQEFVRVGYFVHNDYESEELREKHKENPGESPDMSQPITRNIMAEEPRVTRFRINWGDGPAVEMPPEENGENGEVVTGESGGLVVHDTESMLEPLPSSSFNDVHSMDESSNVEMEMAF